MASNTDYAGTPVNRVSSSGGMCEVVLSANNAVAGNSGTDLACREVYLYAAISNTKMAFVSFASSNVSRGIPIPMITAQAVLSSCGVPQWLAIPIDNIAKLWFFGAVDDEQVQVLYRR